MERCLQLAGTMKWRSPRDVFMELFGRLRKPLTLLALVLAQSLWLAVQVQRPLRSASSFTDVREAPKITALRSWTMLLFSPVERVTHATGAGLYGLWANYVYLRHTREQNVVLQGEVARLRQEQAGFAEDAAEGRRLQSLLAFKQQYIAQTVAAEVIGTSGSDRSHVLWINKGSADGLQPEQPVLTPDGVVGKLRDVTAHSAQLLLLNDANSGAGVFLASTRMRGILRGTASGEVVINNLTPDDRIKPGERVLTSGGDQVFPRGLPVGVITDVAPDPAHPPYTLIHIQPAANLHRLDEVLVVTGTVPELTPAAKGDAAQAEAMAAENKRAADMIAERLPSLHSDSDSNRDGSGNKEDGAQLDTGPGTGTEVTTPAQAKAAAEAAKGSGGVPGVPNSGMPKVQPPLHPDRYSPGAAPPAADLTPGAPAQPPPQPQLQPQP